MLEVEGGPELEGIDGGCPTVDKRLLVKPIKDVFGVPGIQQKIPLFNDINLKFYKQTCTAWTLS